MRPGNQRFDVFSKQHETTAVTELQRGQIICARTAGVSVKKLFKYLIGPGEESPKSWQHMPTQTNCSDKEEQQSQAETNQQGYDTYKVQGVDKYC